ncbi:MAG: phosphoribosylaminoimidazolesuccinocarboxamide synthase [Thiotrichaceae bacterium]
MPNTVSLTTMLESQLSSLSLLRRGKVRDLYAIDAEHLLIVATDRLSAFDVILPTPIPNKGVILTTISNFWFDFTRSLIPNHLTDKVLTDVVSPQEAEQLAGRAVVVRHLKPLPIEAIVRGYVAGSGWKDYQKTGKVCGLTLPPDLRLADKLPDPIYTPSSKASSGHDENIDFAQTVALVGEELAHQVREVSLQIYTHARDYSLSRGIIIADTKFEFGVDEQGKLVLMDEVLTPDSSRFWAMEHYQVGISPPSFDKQFVRDYLESLDWDKTPPAPTLPIEIAEKTAQKYQEALRKLVTTDR